MPRNRWPMWMLRMPWTWQSRRRCHTCYRSWCGGSARRGPPEETGWRAGGWAPPAVATPKRAVLAAADDVNAQLAVLRGLNEALKGRKQVAMPEGWQKVSEKLARSDNEEVRSQSRALAVTFGDTKAMERLRQVLADPKASVEARR